MARARHVVVLALVMFAIIGLACAADPPMGISDDFLEEDYDYDDMIGTRPVEGEGALPPNSVLAAPIGGPVPPGAFDNNKQQNSTPSAASSSLHRVSAVAGAATAALAGFFYFWRSIVGLINRFFIIQCRMKRKDVRLF